MIPIKLVRCPNKQRVCSKSEQDLVYNLPQAVCNNAAHQRTANTVAHKSRRGDCSQSIRACSSRAMKVNTYLKTKALLYLYVWETNDKCPT